MEGLTDVMRFDRYLLSQLIAVFGFFSLVLVGLQWVNQAVFLFDWLIGDGQSAWVFVQMSLLTLPQVIAAILPLSAFVAAIYVANRLMSDSELVVMQAAGFSAWRMSWPVLVFGVMVLAMVLILNHALVPMARASLAERGDDIRENVTARFLKDGRFTHPLNNVTLYIRALSDRGELLDLFLEDRRNGSDTVIIARRALVARSDSGPKLLMFDGQIQTQNKGVLSVTRFGDFTYDLAEMMPEDSATGRSLDQISSVDLLRTDPSLAATPGLPAKMLWREFHARNSQALLALASGVIGFAAILIGSFSRFGLWRQVAIAVVLAICVQGMHTVGFSASMGPGAFAWVWLYSGAALGLFFALSLIVIAERPRRVAKGGA